MDRIVFTGGGTGGHIFPGLAVIDELRGRVDADIVWIGSSRGIDRSLVEGHGVKFFGVSSGKLRRYFDWKNFADAFRVFLGFAEAFFILLRLRPRLVFSKGGFVSVPPCVAARILGIPLVTHECDLSPGLATRINARFADEIFVTCEETAQMFPKKYRPKVTVTGNPVRPAFYSGDAERGRAFLECAKSDLPIVLVLGGSLGARQVNAIVAEGIDSLCASCVVVHQTGAQNEDQAIRPVGEPARTRYKPYAFIRGEMADVLAAATIVIARSGANTVWECAAAGKPMILIPLEKGSSRGDQVENARYFERAGAAMVFVGADASAKPISDAVARLLSDDEARSAMAARSATLGSGRPAAKIADLLAAKFSLSSGRIG